MMINLDLNGIRAFVVVADKQSFSQAAELLYITQPAISKRIASLESILSIKLFDRIGRRVILTEAGNRILPNCRLVLDTVSDTAKIIHNLSGQISGNLLLGTSHHIGLHHLPPVIREYVRRFPKVELEIQFLSSEQVCKMVLEGELELGIITLPLQVPENLTTKILWHDQMHVIVSPQHALCQETPCRIEQLNDYNAILPERGTYTRTIIEREFEKNKINLHTKFATNYLETIKMMVSVGLGWSVLPNSLIDNDLQIIKIAEINFSRKLGIIQHKQRTLSNAATAMTELLNDDQ